jgi:hypothetical protein
LGQPLITQSHLIALLTIFATALIAVVLPIYPAIAVVPIAGLLLGPIYQSLKYFGARASSILSAHTLLQTALVLLFVSGIVFRRRTTESIGDAPVDLAALARIVLVLLVSVATMHRLLQWRLLSVRLYTQPAIFPLFLLTLWGVLSTSWSYFPAWTIYRSFEYLIDLTVVALIALLSRSFTDIKSYIDTTWMLVGLLLATVYMNMILLPSRTILPLSGPIGFSIESSYPAIARNGIGALSAIIFVVSFARILTRPRDRLPYVVTLLGSAPILFISQTRSAIVPALFAITCILLLCRRATIAGIVLIPTASLWVLTGGIGAFMAFIDRGQQASNISTLSGRTLYWEKTWELALERPFTGYGAYAGGRFLVAQLFDQDLSNVHGTFPEVLIDFGFPGVILVSLALIATWKEVLIGSFYTWSNNSATSLPGSLYIEIMGVLIILSSRIVFTVTLIWHPSIEFLIIIAFVAFSIRMRKARRMQTIQEPH